MLAVWRHPRQCCATRHADDRPRALKAGLFLAKALTPLSSSGMPSAGALGGSPLARRRPGPFAFLGVRSHLSKALLAGGQDCSLQGAPPGRLLSLARTHTAHACVRRSGGGGLLVARCHACRGACIPWHAHTRVRCFVARCPAGMLPFPWHAHACVRRSVGGGLLVARCPAAMLAFPGMCWRLSEVCRGVDCPLQALQNAPPGCLLFLGWHQNAAASFEDLQG